MFYQIKYIYQTPFNKIIYIIKLTTKLMIFAKLSSNIFRFSISKFNASKDYYKSLNITKNATND